MNRRRLTGCRTDGTIAPRCAGRAVSKGTPALRESTIWMSRLQSLVPDPPPLPHPRRARPLLKRPSVPLRRPRGAPANEPGESSRLWGFSSSSLVWPSITTDLLRPTNQPMTRLLNRMS